MKTIPTIEECMVPHPHTIGEDIPLNKAIHQMREFRIRHLPVLRAGELVGVLTESDVRLALSVHPQATDLMVGDVMSEAAYAVVPETPLDEITEKMFRHKYGCAVVIDHKGKTIGIFTANDALKVLTSRLRDIPLSAFSRTQLRGELHRSA